MKEPDRPASRRKQDLFAVFVAIGRSRLCSDKPLYLMRCEIESIFRLSKLINDHGIDWKSVMPRLRIASNETDANKQWWKEYDPTSQSH